MIIFLYIALLVLTGYVFFLSWRIGILSRKLNQHCNSLYPLKFPPKYPLISAAFNQILNVHRVERPLPPELTTISPEHLLFMKKE
jgi:hypothetical protein